MMIVDAQIHLWAKGKPSAHHRQTPFLMDEALAGMDEAGVDRAVIHPVMWDPDSNEVAVEAARAHPDRFAIMGWFYLDQADQRAAIETWKKPARDEGIAVLLHRSQVGVLAERRHAGVALARGTNGWTFPVSLQATNFLPRVAGDR